MALIHRLDEFRAKIRAKKANCTYDQLEEEYGINRWYFWNIIKDDSYTPPEWVQQSLGIQSFKPAPVCVECGEVHTTKRCTSSNHKPGPPRISIRLDNPESAIRSIKKHMKPEVIVELIKLLEENYE